MALKRPPREIRIKKFPCFKSWLFSLREKNLLRELAWMYFMRAQKNIKELLMLPKKLPNLLHFWSISRFRNKSGSAPLPEVTPATSCCSADHLPGLADWRWHLTFPFRVIFCPSAAQSRPFADNSQAAGQGWIQSNYSDFRSRPQS